MPTIPGCQPRRATTMPGAVPQPLASISANASASISSWRARRWMARGSAAAAMPTAAAGGHALGGKTARRPGRVEEGVGGERLGRDEVVIDDHRVDPPRPHHLEALVVAGAAIAGDEEGSARGEDALERARREPVAAL